MAASFIVDGENVNIRFEYSAPITVAQETVESCVEYLWNSGFRGSVDPAKEFSSLIPQELLDILDTNILTRIKDLARVQFVINAEAAAKAAASEEAKTKFI